MNELKSILNLDQYEALLDKAEKKARSENFIK